MVQGSNGTYFVEYVEACGDYSFFDCCPMFFIEGNPSGPGALVGHI